MTNENQVQEVANVEAYLTLVKEEKFEEAKAYLAKFFGEGEEVNTEALAEFSEVVRKRAQEETAEEATEDDSAVEVEVQEADTDS